MRKNIKCLFVAIMILVMVISGFLQERSMKMKAMDSILPIAYDNLGRMYDLDRYTGLVSTSSGFVRVFPTYDSQTEIMSVYAEEYDDKFNIVSRKQIPLELSWYMGFYSTDENYYMVFCQNNSEEDDSKEVYRVVKYSKQWERLEACSLTGGLSFGQDVAGCFDAGSFDITEQNGKLYFACGHSGYYDPYVGRGHQGLIMYEVDMTTMEGRICDANLGHSFSQDLTTDEEGNVYLLEESEGNRETTLKKFSSPANSYEVVTVLEYGGVRTSSWAIATFATADDVEVSSDNIIAVGSSIDQSTYDDATYDSPYTIYLSLTPKGDFSGESTTLKWFTSATSNGGFKDITLTKVNDDRFLLMWETEIDEESMATANEYDGLNAHVLHYMFIDGNGNQLSSEMKVSAPESSCTPIVKGDKAIFYASDGANLGFYSIDVNTGEFTEKIYQLAGIDAVWDCKDGVLTVSGKGELYYDFLTKSIVGNRDHIKKIVIKSGITKIPDVPEYTFAKLANVTEIIIEDGVKYIGDNAFKDFSSLTNVVIGKGTEYIGEGAFFGNEKLKTVTIPDSVVFIAEDAFHSGRYWSGSREPVIYVKIFCSENSYAAQYADVNGITVQYSGEPGVPGVTDVDVFYRTHIQSFGWEGEKGDISTWKSNGVMSGTSGKAKRLEGINVVVDTEDGTMLDLGIQYTTHCQSYGWLPWSSDGDMNGTEGEAKRLEAIKIQLTGEHASYYDVYYRVHAQTYGWLGWAKNGAPAGTAGYGKRLEGIQIVVVKSGESFNQKMENIVSARNEAFMAKQGKSPVVNVMGGTNNANPEIPGADVAHIAYRTHVQSYGWQAWKYDGQTSGTSNEAKRLEGINIEIRNSDCTGNIVYTTHVQSYGWQGDLKDQSTWKKNGEMSGTSGEAKRLEAICIDLTGELEDKYDIYYRVHAQSFGWLGWACNGSPAGTAGYGKRLEAIQIQIVPKGEGVVFGPVDGPTRWESYIEK